MYVIDAVKNTARLKRELRRCYIYTAMQVMVVKKMDIGKFKGGPI